MKIKATVFMLLMVTVIFSQDQKLAFDVSCGFVHHGTSIYFPVPSVSFYLLKNKSLHEISVEGCGKESKEITASGFGITYSFLFRMPLRQLYLGPTIGLLGYSKDTEIFNSYYYSEGKESEVGQYSFGAKFALILGESTLRFKIQNRLMFGFVEWDGIDEDAYYFGWLNMINTSLIFAF